MGQTLGRQGQDHLVHAGQPALPLTDELGLEGARHIARHPHLDRADVAHHGLGAAAVAAVAAVLPGPVVPVIAQAIGDLAFQRRPSTRLVSCRGWPPSPVSRGPWLRARVTSVEISCSSVIERPGSTGSSLMDSDSTAVSDIKRLFLDHQIRRSFYRTLGPAIAAPG